MILNRCLEGLPLLWRSVNRQDFKIIFLPLKVKHEDNSSSDRDVVKILINRTIFLLFQILGASDKLSSDCICLFCLFVTFFLILKVN